MKTTLDSLLENPRKLLLFWSLYHLVVWTLLPLLCNTCLPLDSVEAVMWGSQWAWGYDKHPPLSAWAAELFTNLLGDGGLYLLSQLCIVTAGLGIYRLGRLLRLTAAQALIAVLLLDTVYYYQYISVEFNVNYLQMPFWAWGWVCGIDAIQNKRFGSWLGLGLCVALGALTKYIAVFMLAPLFAVWWARGELKQTLRSPGLYVAGALAILLFIPHLFWMKEHDWITITYGLKRGGTENAQWWHHIWNPLAFLLEQAAILLPLLLTAAFCGIKSSGKADHHPGSFSIAMGAYLAIAALSLATGMAPVTMWAAPMALAVGLWLVPRFQMDRHPKAVLVAMVLMSTTFVVAYAIVYGLGPRFRDKPHRVNYPGKALAREVEARWHQQQDTPLPHVVADEFLGGIVNHYGHDTPAVMIRGNLARSTYLTEDDVHQRGALVLWLKSRDHLAEKQASLADVFPDLESRYPQLQLEPDLVIPWPRTPNQQAGRYGIAYIPPANVDDASSFVAQNPKTNGIPGNKESRQNDLEAE